MARDVGEIKKSMTDLFMANESVREKYGLEEGSSFEECFSVVSIENILFYIVAMCCYVMEVLFDNYKTEVERMTEGSVVASVPWYHKMALRYQHGDALVFDETIQGYGYAVTDPKKQKIKYVAVRDRGTYVQILVAEEENGMPKPLSDDILMSFKDYMNRIKIAGVILDISSLPADIILVTAKIYVDPLVINNEGIRVSDGCKPVEDAVKQYLKEILYGGTFNKNKLVDAIQTVEGVKDIELKKCECSSDGGDTFIEITSNNYTAVSGCLMTLSLNNTLSYVV